MADLRDVLLALADAIHRPADYPAEGLAALIDDACGAPVPAAEPPQPAPEPATDPDLTAVPFGTESTPGA